MCFQPLKGSIVDNILECSLISRVPIIFIIIFIFIYLHYEFSQGFVFKRYNISAWQSVWQSDKVAWAVSKMMHISNIMHTLQGDIFTYGKRDEVKTEVNKNVFHYLHYVS